MLRHVLFAVLKAWTITSDRLRFPWSSPGIQKRVSRMLARLASRIHLQLRQPPRRSTWYCLLRQSACRQVVHRSRPNFVVQVKVECTRSVMTGTHRVEMIYFLPGRNLSRLLQHTRRFYRCRYRNISRRLRLLEVWLELLEGYSHPSLKKEKKKNCTSCLLHSLHPWSKRL